jgi:membrane-associated phospholipid phosphatase
MILLNDPFVQFFGSGDVLTKDLFFSGHTATLFLLFLISEKKYLKIIFLLCTILVGIAVLLQHVHYTIDVLAAPFFAYASYKLAAVINEKIKIKKYADHKK